VSAYVSPVAWTLNERDDVRGRVDRPRGTDAACWSRDKAPVVRRRLHG